MAKAVWSYFCYGSHECTYFCSFMTQSQLHSRLWNDPKHIVGTDLVAWLTAVFGSSGQLKVKSGSPLSWLALHWFLEGQRAEWWLTVTALSRPRTEQWAVMWSLGSWSWSQLGTAAASYHKDEYEGLFFLYTLNLFFNKVLIKNHSQCLFIICILLCLSSYFLLLYLSVSVFCS